MWTTTISPGCHGGLQTKLKWLPFSGARLFMDTRDAEAQDRIHLSSGIRQVTADPSSYGGMYYVDNHYKPGLPWRAANKTEMAALLANGHDFVPATDLQLFRLPDAIIDKFAELEIRCY